MLELFLTLGVILFFAFFGVILTKKFAQSTIIAYILIGMFIQYFGVSTATFDYTSEEPTAKLIHYLAQIGLVLLLFFVGVEFSVTKLKKTQKPAILLAAIDIGLCMFIGFFIGTYFGWSLIESFFLACIVSMSSVAVTAKVLEEFKREDRPETDVLVSLMVMEDVVGVILLAIASTFALTTKMGIISIGIGFSGVIALFGFFIILAFIFIPVMLKKFERIKSKEALVLFALSVIFLSAALAEFFGIAAIIGAFLIGISFSETKFADKIKTELLSFKNAFVAVFFVSFGMLINPYAFLQPSIIALIVILVSLVIVSELFVLSAVAYLSGYSSGSSVSIGVGALGRSEEAIIFAAVGGNLKSVSTGEYILSANARYALYPFTGGFCFILSLFTAIFMKLSYKIADFFSKIMPTFIKNGAQIIIKTIRPIMHPTPIPFLRKKHKVRVGLLFFSIFLGLVIFFTNYTPDNFLTTILLIGLFLAAPPLLFYLWYAFKKRYEEIVAKTSYSGLGIFSDADTKTKIVHYMLALTLGALIAILLIPAIWKFNFLYTLYVIPTYIIFFLLCTYWINSAVVTIPYEKIVYERKEKLIPAIGEREIGFTYRKKPWEVEYKKHKRG